MIPSTWPFVSVVMPIRNESAFIHRSLGSVLSQDYPSDCLEVLVVDGMSSDGTRDIVKRLIRDRGPYMSVRMLDNPSGTVPAALNIGVHNARGEIITRVDGHCEVASDFISRCVEALQRTGADNVGGVACAVGAGARGRAIALAVSSPFGVGGARFRYAKKAGWVDTVFPVMWRSEVFQRIGLFDEELVRNQDDEFNLRLAQAGGRIWLDPSIRLPYYSRSDLRGLWRQYFQYGLYKVRVIQKRRGVASWRHLVPAVFVLALAASLVVSACTRRSRWALPVIVPYSIANLGVAGWTAHRDRAALPFVPAAFATLHLAYGTGFLTGIWRWRRYFIASGSP